MENYKSDRRKGCWYLKFINSQGIINDMGHVGGAPHNHSVWIVECGKVQHVLKGELILSKEKSAWVGNGKCKAWVGETGAVLLKYNTLTIVVYMRSALVTCIKSHNLPSSGLYIHCNPFKVWCIMLHIAPFWTLRRSWSESLTLSSSFSATAVNKSTRLGCRFPLTTFSLYT